MNEKIKDILLWPTKAILWVILSPSIPFVGMFIFLAVVIWTGEFLWAVGIIFCSLWMFLANEANFFNGRKT